jgi:signal recognition particle receptor subunit beta
MAQLDLRGKAIQGRIVYYGPGLCGKTTNLEYINRAVDNAEEMVSLATEGDRTIFFDLLPVELGKIGGITTSFKLYTVPGQVRYNRTRKMVLNNVDGLVFVADSQPQMRESNLESWDNLFSNLRDLDIDPDKVPTVLQYNKRDLPNLLSVEELDGDLNEGKRYTVFLASAVNGEGVLETLAHISNLVYQQFARELGVKLPEPRAAEGKEKEAAPGAAAAGAWSARGATALEEKAFSPARRKGTPHKGGGPKFAAREENARPAARGKPAAGIPKAAVEESAARSAGRREPAPAKPGEMETLPDEEVAAADKPAVLPFATFEAEILANLMREQHETILKAVEQSTNRIIESLSEVVQEGLRDVKRKILKELEGSLENIGDRDELMELVALLSEQTRNPPASEKETEYPRREKASLPPGIKPGSGSGTERKRRAEEDPRREKASLPPGIKPGSGSGTERKRRAESEGPALSAVKPPRQEIDIEEIRNIGHNRFLKRGKKRFNVQTEVIADENMRIKTTIFEAGTVVDDMVRSYGRTEDVSIRKLEKAAAAQHDEAIAKVRRGAYG